MIKYTEFTDHRNDGSNRQRVIATLRNCEDDAYNVLCKYLPNYIHIDKSAVKMPNYIRAVATCHVNDTYDSEIGKKVAKEKVIRKYNRAMTKILNRFGADMSEYLDILDEKINHFDD